MSLKIKWVGSPNFRAQKGIKKTSITVHWMAGTLEGTARTFANPDSNVSTHYGIADNKVHQYVDEKDYAFGNGHTEANKTSISIEHEGGYLLKDGSRKKPTPATHETSAQLCAEISKRHGLGKLKIGKNIFPHKHWVATACPGTLDLALIVKRANELLGASDVPNPAPVVVPTPAPVIKADPKKYITIKPGDSYWKVAARSLEVPNTPRYAAKIMAESVRLQKLNDKKSLVPGKKARIK